MLNLPFFIARRYLFAKKSHNVINIISLISAVGIGIGSMALIVILSVYNGFDTLVKSFYQEYQPNFIVTPQQGKSFYLDSACINAIDAIEGISSFQPVVEEDVFVQYGDYQSVAFVKGVDSTYGRVSGVAASVKEGEFKTFLGETPHAIVGRELAAELRLRVRFLDALELYFPSRSTSVSILNPAASLNSQTLFPSGIIALNQEFDSKGLFVPIQVARELLEYNEGEVTSLEIYLNGDGLAHTNEIEEMLYEVFGSSATEEGGFTIKNKYQQNETLYKMMKAEKFAVYLILFFVIVIVSVNIFGSLSMLIIEKKRDLQTYMSMGASLKLVNQIFLIQGWLISLMGTAVGILIGLALCLVQQRFGLITLPGNYIVSSYPVDIHLADIFITFFGVAFIGYLIATVPVKLMK